MNMIKNDEHEFCAEKYAVKIVYKHLKTLLNKMAYNK